MANQLTIRTKGDSWPDFNRATRLVGRRFFQIKRTGVMKVHSLPHTRLPSVLPFEHMFGKVSPILVNFRPKKNLRTAVIRLVTYFLSCCNHATCYKTKRLKLSLRVQTVQKSSSKLLNGLNPARVPL